MGVLKLSSDSDMTQGGEALVPVVLVPAFLFLPIMLESTPLPAEPTTQPGTESPSMSDS